MKTDMTTARLPLLFATGIALALPAHAALNLTFDGGGGGGATQSGDITIDVTTAGTGIVRDQGLTLAAPSGAGSLAGLSGTITIGFIALGTAADNFDSTDFTGGSTYGPGGATLTTVYSSPVSWAGGSDINENVNNFPGQAIVFTIDLSGVTGDTSGLQLTAVRMFNDNVADGARLSHLASGAGSSTAVYGGGGAIGNDVTYTASQSIADGDALALWTAPSGGQRRLRGLTFEVIPVPEPSSGLLVGLGIFSLLGRRRR